MVDGGLRGEGGEGTEMWMECRTGTVTAQRD